MPEPLIPDVLLLEVQSVVGFFIVLQLKLCELRQNTVEYPHQFIFVVVCKFVLGAFLLKLQSAEAPDDVVAGFVLEQGIVLVFHPALRGDVDIGIQLQVRLGFFVLAGYQLDIVVVGDVPVDVRVEFLELVGLPLEVCPCYLPDVHIADSHGEHVVEQLRVFGRGLNLLG